MPPEHYLVVDVSQPLKVSRARALLAFERVYLVELLARCGGNVSAAARMAGIDRVHVYRLLWKHGLR